MYSFTGSTRTLLLSEVMQTKSPFGYVLFYTIRQTDTNTPQGESAGASSVGFQLVAYGGRNDSIITRAIMESGNSVPYSRMPPRPLPLKPSILQTPSSPTR